MSLMAYKNDKEIKKLIFEIKYLELSSYTEKEDYISLKLARQIVWLLVPILLIITKRLIIIVNIL